MIVKVGDIIASELGEGPIVAITDSWIIHKDEQAAKVARLIAERVMGWESLLDDSEFTRLWPPKKILCRGTEFRPDSNWEHFGLVWRKVVEAINNTKEALC